MIKIIMKKEITKDILLKAGLVEKDGMLGCSTETDGRKRTIVVTLDGTDMYGRDCSLMVYNGNRDPIGYACIQTVEHFNKLMELLNIDFKLKED